MWCGVRRCVTPSRIGAPAAHSAGQQRAHTQGHDIYTQTTAHFGLLFSVRLSFIAHSLGGLIGRYPATHPHTPTHTAMHIT